MTFYRRNWNVTRGRRTEKSPSGRPEGLGSKTNLTAVAIDRDRDRLATSARGQLGRGTNPRLAGHSLALPVLSHRRERGLLQERLEAGAPLPFDLHAPRQSDVDLLLDEILGLLGHLRP